MESMQKYIVIPWLLWNFVVFFIYGIDKSKARREAERISEKVLLLTALIFGAVGAMFGMVIFNHKTSKMKFRLLVPLFVIVNIILAGIFFYKM